MEFPLIARCANTPSTTSFLGCKVSSYDFPIRNKRKYKEKFSVLSVKAMTEKSSTGEASVEIREREGYTGSTMEVTTFNQSFSDAQLPVWEKIGALVRLSYGIGTYGAMALAGKFICSVSGIICTGGFIPSLDAIVEGLGYAAPPIMALLFILDDEVVKLSPHARAIRDVEDEELRNFFYGMSPWQFILIVAASSVGEELFYRSAVKGALADIFLRSTDLAIDVRGMASLVKILFLTSFSNCCSDSPKMHYFWRIQHAHINVFEESEQHTQTPSYKMSKIF